MKGLHRSHTVLYSWHVASSSSQGEPKGRKISKRFKKRSARDGSLPAPTLLQDRKRESPWPREGWSITIMWVWKPDVRRSEEMATETKVRLGSFFFLPSCQGSKTPKRKQWGQGSRSFYEEAAVKDGQTQTLIHWFSSLGSSFHPLLIQQEWHKREADFRLLPTHKGTQTAK